MKKDSFLKGASLLVASACIVKLGGVLFKIPLASLLGGSGMGIFMAAYSVFSPFYAFFASGLTPAVSSFISKERILKGDREACLISRASIIILLIYGAGVYAVFIFLAPFFASFTGGEAVLRSLYSIAPCLIFCTLEAGLRGFFEGNLYMFPSSVSLVAEVFCKFIFALYLTRLSLRNSFSEIFSYGTLEGKNIRNLSDGLCKAAELATSQTLTGTAFAAFASLLLLFVFYIPYMRNKKGFPGRSHFKKAFSILKYAIPISLSSLVISLYPSIDMYAFLNFLPSFLEKGGALPSFFHFLNEEMPLREIPNFLYGCYSGLAMTVFHFVPSLASSISAAALPVISSSFAGGRQKKTEEAVKMSIKAAAFVAFPIGTGMLLMPGEILSFLFVKSPLEAETASYFLYLLGPASILAGLTSPLFAALQAFGRPKVPAAILSFSLLLKLFFAFFLSFFPSFAPFAPAISTLISYGFVLCISFKSLFKCMNERFSAIHLLFIPFIVSLFSCLFVKLVFLRLTKLSKSPLILVISVLLGALLYIISMLFSCEFEQEFIKMLYRNKNG